MKVAKKKKKGRTAVNGNTKQKQAEFRNDYLRRMAALFNEKLGQGSYNQLNALEKDVLFLMRVHSPKLVFTNPEAMPGNLRKLLKKFVNLELKTTESSIPYKDRNLYMDEYLGIWQTFLAFFPRIGAGDPSHERIFKLGETFLEIINDKEQDVRETDSMISLSLRLLYLSTIFSFPGKSLSLKIELLSDPIDDTDLKMFRQQIVATVNISTWRTFLINGEKHRAYRLGLNSLNNEFRWMQMASKHLGGSSAFANLPVDIYWQVHADQRLSERMGGADIAFAFTFLYMAFDEPVVHQVGNNTYLIEYSMAEAKVGYFVGSLIEGVLLIRTFLFLTNTGTPEGNALNAKLDLMNADKQFLMLDRLQGYMRMDEATKADLLPHFKGTGCEHLLNLNLGLFDLSKIEQSYNTLSFSISDYLNKDQREESLETMLSNRMKSE